MCQRIMLDFKVNAFFFTFLIPFDYQKDLFSKSQPTLTVQRRDDDFSQIECCYGYQGLKLFFI